MKDGKPDKPRGILVFGLNGSGKTTLGRELARVLDFRHMDHEYYAFGGSGIPYQNERAFDEQIRLMLADIEESRGFVISAATGDFGDKITSRYGLAVFLDAPKELRLERIKRREIERHGERVLEGGDMHKQHLSFMDFAANRPSSRIEKWAETLKCPVIRMDGAVDYRTNAAVIAKQFLQKHSRSRKEKTLIINQKVLVTLQMNSEKGKVILIGGCPRTGKTTLSVRLVKSGKGFSKISGDHIGEAVGAGLRSHKDISADDFELIKKLLEQLIYDAEVYGINSIFDFCSYDFMPEDIEKLSFKDKLDVYFLGFPDIPADEIKFYIKHYAKPADWISHVDDAYIGEVSEKIRAHNIELNEQCVKHNCRFVSTGVGSERDAVLNSLYEEIIGKV